MHGMHQGALRPTRLSYAVSLALASLIATNQASAQEQPVPTVGATANQEVAQVLVVGTRASQQSAISRKKNAATAVDSIVAEDVGAFPDRNVGEAISRIAGISLDRGEFGEGVNVAVRGNAPDLTRVEIDGMGVLAGGGTDLNGGGSGRGVELRELPSDLIKSVDVVKGATADQTEGSLGGGIRIQTRTGLDFKERFMSARVAGQANSINKKWTPDLNLVFADKFLDDRLGIVVTLNKSGAKNEQHRQEVATSSNAGYFRNWDFDNSPEKTFEYNLDTLSTTDPLSNAPVFAGSPFSATPRDILTKSIAAKSKADCYAAFPELTTAQLNTISTSLTNGNRTGAAAQRGSELISCLNQWNDYTPSNVRSIMSRQDDRRVSGDVRLDFKVNNKLTVFVKGNRNERDVDIDFLTLSLGGFSGATGTVVNGKVVPTFTEAGNIRSTAPGTGYYVVNSPSWRSGMYAATGSQVNTDPSTVVVDANHHVTEAVLNDLSVTTDQTREKARTTTTYLQTGGTYRDGAFRAEWMLGHSKADFVRETRRASWGNNYGSAKVMALPNGLWSYDFPSSFSQGDPALYASLRTPTAGTAAVAATHNGPAIPAYTAAQLPMTTQSVGLQYTPRATETSEDTFKLDMSYALPESVPFLHTLKFGINHRKYETLGWGGSGGYAAQGIQGTFGQPGYVPGIFVGSALARGSFYGCENTPGSLAPGGNPCKYGYTANTGLTPTINFRYGTNVVTQKEFQDILAQSMTKQTETFFGSAKDRPASLINGWTEIDIPKLFSLVNPPNYNLDCLKECIATDGKTYAQPVTNLREKVDAAYFMGEFKIDELPFTKRALPFGLEIDGNWGVRYIKTTVQGSGLLTFTSITKNGNFNPGTPNAAAGVNSLTISRQANLERKTTDILPSFNAATWLVPDELTFRYSWSKGMARPGVGQLLPAGNCTYDERLDVDGASDMTCGGVVGNPALEPQTNKNQNFSLEWYPNKDTMLSLAHFRQKGIIGASVRTQMSNMRLFEGSDFVDPVTGRPLGNIEFTVPTYENGPTTARKGWELSSKTAFSFLPSVLRYTGLDLNYTKIRAVVTSTPIRDLLSGDTLPVRGEPKYSYNASLWYDDGALQARVAYQVVTQTFDCISACGANTVNNYPAEGAGRIHVVPYNPGFANFKGETRYIDAKVSYKFKNGIEIFADVRNAGKEMITATQGPYGTFENGAPSVLALNYSGARYSAGMTLRY